MSTPAAEPVATGNWKIDTVHSHVGFAVKHMVVATFRGSFEDYDGALVAGADGKPASRARSRPTRSSSRTRTSRRT